MFMLGWFLHRHFDKARVWLEGRFLWYFSAYVLFMTALTLFVESRSTLFYLAYLPSRVILALATISAAYSFRSLSTKLLRGTDLSYGTYLYHSVVINVFVEMGWLSGFGAIPPIYVASIGLAMLSWFLIEKPALALKSFSPAGLILRRFQAAKSDS
jgi:peptidoglycan/LPS O-acetylase OafA/YrhL